MILYSLYIIIGLALETVATVAFFVQSEPIIIIFILHIIAACFVLYAIYRRRHRFRDFNQTVMWMMFLLMLLVPFLGIIGTLLIARWLLKGQTNYYTQRVQYTKLDDQTRNIRTNVGAGSLNKRLQTPTISTKNRIEALEMASSLPPQKVNKLIRSLMIETQDELRLLAFQLLNKQIENFIRQISKGLHLLEQEKNPEKKAEIDQWIAQQYWEMLYRHLIESSLNEFILEQALQHAETANQTRKSDPNLWYLLGRIYLKLKRYDQAMHAFQQSLQHGESINSIAPYLAEIYFYKKEFHRIKIIMESLSAVSCIQINKDLITFWSGKS